MADENYTRKKIQRRDLSASEERNMIIRWALRHIERKADPEVLLFFNFIKKLMKKEKNVKQNVLEQKNSVIIIDCFKFFADNYQDPPSKILDILTYYNYHLNEDTIPKSTVISQDGKTITKKIAIEVNMVVGGHNIKFVMEEAERPFQIQITFLDGFKKSYNEIIKDLDGLESRRNAEAILSVIDAPGGEEVKSFERLSLSEKSAAFRLIVFTLLAEGACPDEIKFKEDVENFKNTTEKKEGLVPRGGWPGIGKIVRGILKRIKNGEMTFDSAFNPTNGTFLPARKNGKKIMYGAIFNGEKSPDVAALINYVSSESGSQNSLEIKPSRKKKKH